MKRQIYTTPPMLQVYSNYDYEETQKGSKYQWPKDTDQIEWSSSLQRTMHEHFQIDLRVFMANKHKHYSYNQV